MARRVGPPGKRREPAGRPVVHPPEVDGPGVGTPPATARGRRRGRGRGQSQFCGYGQCAALDELAPTGVPGRPAVARREPDLGAGEGDQVTDLGDVHQPVGVGRRDVRAAVRDVAASLIRHRPGCPVDELAAPGEPLRVLDVHHVAAVRLAARVERGVLVLLHDHHLAAGRGGAALAQADRDPADQLAVAQHAHLLGGVVDFERHLPSDPGRRGAVGVTDVVLADRQTRQAGPDTDGRARPPEVGGPVVDLAAVVHPGPGTRLRWVRGDEQRRCTSARAALAMGGSKPTVTGIAVPYVCLSAKYRVLLTCGFVDAAAVVKVVVRVVVGPESPVAVTAAV